MPTIFAEAKANTQIAKAVFFWIRNQDSPPISVFIYIFNMIINEQSDIDCTVHCGGPTIKYCPWATRATNPAMVVVAEAFFLLFPCLPNN